ncbi:MAG: methyltransferase domain-containing protein [Terriglobia bacterium]
MLTERIPSHELMDDDLPASDLAIILDDLWRINRRFGGISGTMKLLEIFFRHTGAHPVRILDIGAGDGRLAATVAQRLNEQAISAKCIALERDLAHLRHGRESARGLGRIAADAFALPFCPGSFELVTCNLFLHHFSGHEAREALHSMADVASEAVLINDLDRRWLPYVLIRYAPFMARHPISRFDGAASVRQAYNRTELLRLAEDAEVGKPEWVELPCFRHGLILWKTNSVPRGRPV